MSIHLFYTMENSWALLNFNMTVSALSSTVDDASTASPSSSCSSAYCCCVRHTAPHLQQRYDWNPFEDNIVDAANRPTFDRWSTFGTNENTSSESDFKSSTVDVMTDEEMTVSLNQDNYYRNTALSGNNWLPITQTIESSAQFDAWNRRHLPLDAADRQSVETPRENRTKKKSKESLVPVVAMAILSQSDRRMALKDINEFIASRGDRSLIEKTTWKNNVRHVLSHYEFFVKNARVASGAGYYWSIHPACLSSFSAGDFSIKKARHAVQQFQKMEKLNREYSQKQKQEHQQPNLTPTNPELSTNGPRGYRVNHTHSRELH